MRMDTEEIKAKVLELFSQPHLVVVFSTVDEADRPQTRLMGAVVPVKDAEFAWHFETKRESRKVSQLAKRPQAQLLAYRPDYSEVATLTGRARLVDDPEVKRAVWDAVPVSGEYFSSWDAPEFAVLRFDAEEVEYLNLTLQLEPFRVRV
jgi:general stress protein 26